LSESILRFRFFRPPVEPELSKDGPDTRRGRLCLHGGRANPRRTAAAGINMDTPAQDQIRNRARELWEQNGRPEGKQDEFWRQAERELQGVMDRGEPSQGSPDDI
jgi:hypothetical protein